MNPEREDALWAAVFIVVWIVYLAGILILCFALIIPEGIPT